MVKSLEEFGLLIEVVSETITNEAKKQKNGFLSILFGTLRDSSSGNLLTGKRMKRPKISSQMRANVLG